MTCLNAMLLTSAVLASIAPVTGLGAEAGAGTGTGTAVAEAAAELWVPVMLPHLR